MCLASVVKQYKRRTDKVITAYKLLDEDRGVYYFPYCYYEGRATCPTGKWIKAEEMTVTTDNHEELYTTGFHCFKVRSEALALSDYVVEVKIRKLHTIGVEWYAGKQYLILVAEELFVPKFKKKEKK